MPQTARRYEIFLPLNYNDGSDVEVEKLLEVETELAQKFGGLTATPMTAPLSGYWRSLNGIMYQDRIRSYIVIDFNPSDENERFIKDYKEILKQRFQQQDLLITAQTIDVF